MNKKNLAIITARGGSKRIPRKNIKDFCGQPIIKYSIDAAIQSGVFDEIMVSTDDDEIAAISKQLGVEIPFKRSLKNSNDFATTADVIIEVLSEYAKLGVNYENACCLYPTAPFITSQDLLESFNALVLKKADTVVPVTPFDYPIWRSFKISNDKLEMNWPEFEKARSQDLAPAYHDAGQFYWLNVKSFLKNNKLFTNNSYPFLLDPSKVQDIDNEADWRHAELKFNILLNSANGR